MPVSVKRRPILWTYCATLTLTYQSLQYGDEVKNALAQIATLLNRTMNPIVAPTAPATQTSNQQPVVVHPPRVQPVHPPRRVPPLQMCCP